jgi:hypothetical protein
MMSRKSLTKRVTSDLTIPEHLPLQAKNQLPFSAACFLRQRTESVALAGIRTCEFQQRELPQCEFHPMKHPCPRNETHTTRT